MAPAWFGGVPATNVDFLWTWSLILVVFNELPDFSVAVQRLLGREEVKSFLVIPSAAKAKPYQKYNGLSIQLIENQRLKLQHLIIVWKCFWKKKSAVLEMPHAPNNQWGSDQSAVWKLRDGECTYHKWKVLLSAYKSIESWVLWLCATCVIRSVMYKIAPCWKFYARLLPTWKAGPYYPAIRLRPREPFATTGTKEIDPSQRAGGQFLWTCKFSLRPASASPPKPTHCTLCSSTWKKTESQIENTDGKRVAPNGNGQNISQSSSPARSGLSVTR